MLLHNILTIPSEVDTAPRVLFATLKYGDRFKHSPAGNICQIFFKGDGFVTVKRADNWLVRVWEGSEAWDKMVIKIAPVRK